MPYFSLQNLKFLVLWHNLTLKKTTIFWCRFSENFIFSTVKELKMLSFSLQSHKELIMNLLSPFLLLFSSILVFSFQSNTILLMKTCFVFIFWDKQSFPPINFVKNLLHIKLQLESCYSLNNSTIIQLYTFP